MLFYNGGSKMKMFKTISLICLIVVMVLSLTGCGKKSDSEKTAEEVQADVEKMSVEQLREKALEYKEAIIAKKDEMAKIHDKLKDVPPNKLAEEMRAMKADVDKINDAIESLTEKYKIYYNKLREKGGDLSDLEI